MKCVNKCHVTHEWRCNIHVKTHARVKLVLRGSLRQCRDGAAFQQLVDARAGIIANSLKTGGWTGDCERLHSSHAATIDISCAGTRRFLGTTTIRNRSGASSHAPRNKIFCGHDFAKRGRKKRREKEAGHLQPMHAADDPVGVGGGEKLDLNAVS